MKELENLGSDRELRAALLRRYKPPEWFHADEVTEPGGRRIDVVALNMWASRGYRVMGFECKVSRADWLRELRDPSKAERIALAVDEFYLVTGPNVVQDTDEVPAPWGWLELRGARFRVHRRLAATTHGTDSTVPRWLLARLCDRVNTALTSSASHEELTKARSEGIEQGRERAESASARQAQRHAELRAAVDLFQERSGIQISEYDRGDIGDAVRLVRNVSSRRVLANLMRGTRETVAREAKSLGEVADRIDKAMGAIEAFGAEDDDEDLVA